MSPDPSAPVGECPVCEAAVSRHRVIIEYERSGGEHAAYAECPDCRTVVRPS